MIAPLLATFCKKHEAPAAAAAPTQAAAAPAATTTTASVAPSNADDLVGLAQGAVIAKAAESIGRDAGSFRMIDEDSRTRWTSAQDKPTGPPTATVIELPQRVTISSVQFDTNDIGLDTHAPKDVKVERSDTSATDGFKPIATVSLVQKDGQTFPADANVAGRFVRLTVTSNHGGGITEIAEFRSFGKKLGEPPALNVSGTYETEWFGTLHLAQNGITLTGCYDGMKSPLVGGVEGRVAKFTLDLDVEKGPVVIVTSADGKNIFGGYWKTNGVSEHPEMGLVGLKKISDTPGTCPGAKKPEDDMAKTLEDEKRLRLYGINFDSDSDHLRDESKPALDLVAAVLKAHADWKITIEGHTDSTSFAEHNQQLSTARANSVKAYLTNAGVDGARLTTAGLGSTKPLASNDTGVGRAANRRVELVKG